MNAAVIPVPYEATTSFLTGCAGGPAAFLRALAEAAPDAVVERVRSSCPIVIDPGPPAPFASFQDMERFVTARIEEHLAARRLPVILGGEHSLSFACFKAVAARLPRLDVIQCDAHSDQREAYEGNPFSHASVMRRIVELHAGAALAAGIRSQSLEEARFMKQRGLPILPPGEVNRTLAWDDAVLKALPGPIYLTVDLDFFDPAAVPGVGTPEPGGVTYQAGLRFLRFVASRRPLAALDLVELLPVDGRPQGEALAVRLLFEILDAQQAFLKQPAACPG